MDWLLPLLLIAGGVLAASSVIVAKKPEARELIAKIAPYQAVIGIVLLITGVLNVFRFGPGNISMALKHAPLLGVTVLGMLLSAILLGIMFGMPMLAKVSAGGAAKGEEMAKKMAPFQALIGLIAIGSALLAILFNLGILKPF